MAYEYISTDGTSLTWEQANTAAIARGGTLAVAKTSADLQELNDYLDTVNYGVGAWIGLKRDGADWKWVDGSVSTTFNWLGGEPNNAFGNENYVHILSNGIAGSTNHNWNDVDLAANNASHFGSPRFGYIIKYESIEDEPTAASVTEIFTSEEKSINGIREFLNGKDGIDIGASNVSVAGLFSNSLGNGVLLPNGNFAEPHALSEFSGANYTNSVFGIAVSDNPLMYHVYENNWGPEGYKDGALIYLNTENEDWDYYVVDVLDEEGNLIFRRNSSRFRIKKDFYYSPTVGDTTYDAYYLEYGYVSYLFSLDLGYYYWKPVTKGGKLLYHFIEKGGPENISVANSSIGDSGATNGVQIWDTVRDIHENPASYHIAKSQSDLTTDPQVATHPVNRILPDFEIFGLNKYSFVLKRSGSGGPWDGTTALDFNTGGGVRFKTDSEPNNSTATEQGGTWSYTVPNGVTKIEIKGVGGGGGSWGAHDGGYGQNTRPGGVGSGFKAIFNVSEGDVFSGNIGNAGGAGYYNGGVGGPGSATTLKKNGVLVVTANAGGNASGSAFGVNGTSVKASGWSAYAESIDLYTGTHGNKILSGGDGSCPACGYDPWGYVNHPSYNISDIGTPALDANQPLTPRSYKVLVTAAKGGDLAGINPYLSSTAAALGYSLPTVQTSAQTDVTINPRPYTVTNIGGLAQVTGWIIITEL